MLHPEFASLPPAGQRAGQRRYLAGLVILLVAGLCASAGGRWWRTLVQAQKPQSPQNHSRQDDRARNAARLEVRLMEFDAVTHENNESANANRRALVGVTLRWRTGYEADILGFNVYRDEAGERLRINPSLIAGSALLTGANGVLMAGQSYSWHDRQGGPGTGYWLEVVELSGAARWHGPVYAQRNGKGEARGFGEKDQVNARLLAEINAEVRPDIQREWASADETENSLGLALKGEPGAWQAAGAAQWLRAQATAGASAWTTVPNEKAAKLAVTKTGWYRVTAAELTASGFNPNVSPALLRLYADGSEVPIKTAGKGNRVEALEFYGRGNDLPTTGTRVYWLVANTLATNDALRLDERQAKNAGTLNTASFGATVERKDRSVYFSGLFNGEAENWFGPVVSNNAIVQTLNTRWLNNSTAGTAQLELTLQGVTTQAHTVMVEVNGHTAAPSYFTGQARHVASFSLPLSWLLDGANAIRIFSIAGGGDISLIEVVRLRYPRRYTADNDALNFSLNAGQAAFINGFSTPNIRVLEVSGAAAGGRELLVKVHPSGTGFGFALQSEAGGSYGRRNEGWVERSGSRR